MGEQYYFKQLNKDQQKAYYAMLRGLTALDRSFSVPRLSGPELTDIYFLLRMDHPEIFYTVKFTYRYYDNSENVELIPEYIFEKSRIREQQTAMESRIRKLVLAAEKLDEKGRELYIHDFICQNIKYDKLKKPYSHEIIGPLGHGVSVCEGIAKTVKILADRLGLWCIVALAGANPEKGIKYRHTWNIIRLGGKYYHLDATFDNSLGRADLIRYDYFNLNDRQIFRDHEPVLYRIPACEDGAKSYYQEKKLSFTKLPDVEKRSAQAAKKKRPLIFNWRGGYLTREVFSDIIKLVDEGAASAGRRAKVLVNLPQAVLQVEFEDIPAENRASDVAAGPEIAEDPAAIRQAAASGEENGTAPAGVIVQEANEGELYGEG